MDWAPVPALRELRRIVGVMDRSSKQILSDTRKRMSGGVNVPEGFQEKLDATKKNILSVMCMRSLSLQRSSGLTWFTSGLQ